MFYEFLKTGKLDSYVLHSRCTVSSFKEKSTRTFIKEKFKKIIIFAVMTEGFSPGAKIDYHDSVKHTVVPCTLN